jgi:hypothetical protein
MRSTRNIDQKEISETLAIQGLAFLASDMERLEPFLSLTGLNPDGLRAAAAEPGFLAGVLDHIAGNESLLLQFAADAGIDPAEIGRARETLRGPGSDWEP